MARYKIGLIKKVHLCLDFWRCENFNFLAKIFLTFRSKCKLRIIYRFLSQCIKTGSNLLYKTILLQEPMEPLEVEPTELKYYLKQESECLSKHPIKRIVSSGRFSQKSYNPSFHKLSRTKYRNLFRFMGQFRYVSTANNKEPVENFGGDSIDTVESWKFFLKSLDQQSSINYVQKENGEFPQLSTAPFFELFKQIKILTNSYCFLVSTIFKQKNNTIIKAHLSSKFISNEIEKMQQLFIESSSIRLLAIYNLKNFSGSRMSGADNIAFTSLAKKKQDYLTHQIKGTRYSKSSKNYKVKKDLPKAAVIGRSIEHLLKQDVSNENSKLCWLLYKKCNVKSLRKNYRGSAVLRVWVSKSRFSEFRPLDIPTLRDRVLQTIMHMSLIPFAECQAGTFSLGLCPKGFAGEPISSIAGQLRIVDTTQSHGDIFKQVSYERYKKHQGLRHRVRSY